MPAQIDARDEALRRAERDARVVLAKHPCVTGGGARRIGGRGELLDLRFDCDRILAAYERRDVGRGQDAEGAGGAE